MSSSDIAGQTDHDAPTTRFRSFLKSSQSLILTFLVLSAIRCASCKYTARRSRITSLSSPRMNHTAASGYWPSWISHSRDASSTNSSQWFRSCTLALDWILLELDVKAAGMGPVSATLEFEVKADVEPPVQIVSEGEEGRPSKNGYRGTWALLIHFKSRPSRSA